MAVTFLAKSSGRIADWRIRALLRLRRKEKNEAKADEILRTKDIAL
jgi:hypothetical protein